jgi:hypothetical protein
MREPANTGFRRRNLAAQNGFDIDRMVAVLVPGLHFENHSHEPITVSAQGREAFSRLAEQFAGLFAERAQRLPELECWIDWGPRDRQRCLSKLARQGNPADVRSMQTGRNHLPFAFIPILDQPGLEWLQLIPQFCVPVVSAEIFFALFPL